MTLIQYLLAFLLAFPVKVLAVPDVRKYIPLEMGQFEIPVSGSVASASFRNAAERLTNELSSTGQPWTAVDTSQISKATIQLLSLGSDPRIPYGVDDIRYRESYIIKVTETEIKIYAGGKAGAMYAVNTLMKLVRNKKKLDAAVMVDYPDYRWRGIVIRPRNTPCRDPLKLSDKEKEAWLECMKSEISGMANMRLNFLGLLSPIFNRMSDGDVGLLKKLFVYARKNNLEPVPIIDTKLWGVPPEKLNLDAIEGVYHEKQPFKVHNGYVVADKKMSMGAVRWEAGHRHGRSWKDQSKQGARWSVKRNGNNENGFTRFAISLCCQNKPWTQSLLLKDPLGGGRIRVQPNSYYELGIRVKAGSNEGGRLFVGVSQYNRFGLRIEDMNRYPVKLVARRSEYIKRWVPVFTSENTHSLLIRLAPGLTPGQRGRLELEVGDIELRPMNVELINVLDNEETSPTIVSEDGKTTFERGVDFSIVSSPVREWRKYAFEDIVRLRIKVNPESKLKEGDKVRVSYDTLPLEYRAIPMSKYSAVSKYTYGEFSRLFRQLARLAPRFVMTSFTEHYGGLNRDSRSRRLGLSNRNLLIGYINSLERLLRHDGPIKTLGGHQFEGAGMDSATLLVWDDMLNPWHNGKGFLYQTGFGGLKGATGILPGGEAEMALSKTVWLASWWYKDEDEKGVVKNTPRFYEKKGFDYFVSSWHQKGGIENWLKVADPEKTQGFLATTWDGKTGGVKMASCAGWNRKNHSSCLVRK